MLGSSRAKWPKDDIEARADSPYPPSHLSSREEKVPGSQNGGGASFETNSLHLRFVDKKGHQVPTAPKRSTRNGSRYGRRHDQFQSLPKQRRRILDRNGRMPGDPSRDLNIEQTAHREQPSGSLRPLTPLDNDAEGENLALVLDFFDRASQELRQMLEQRATTSEEGQSANRRQGSRSPPPATDVQDFAPASPSPSASAIRSKQSHCRSYKTVVDKR